MRAMSFPTPIVPFIVGVAAFAIGGDPERSPPDWPQWRGPKRDAISTEVGLAREWPQDGPPLLWRADGLGRGFSSVAVADGRIYTMGKRNRGADLIALALDGGKELWSVEVGGGEPNCTPTCDGGLVFAIGRDGDLVCARAADGELIWRKHFGRDFGGRMMSGWGYSESPLVDGERLVCTPGGNDAVIVSLDKRTGELAWKAKLPSDVGRRGGDGAAYSSIVVSEACGVRQYVQLAGRGVISVAAADGRFLWSYNRIANGTANIPTPIVRRDLVFCSTGYDTGAALLRLSPHDGGVKATEVYFLEPRTLQNHHGGMVLVGDHVYCGHGHNRGEPICIELESGKVAWRARERPGSGSAAVLYADGHLYFRYEDGTMALIEATPDRYALKSTFELSSRQAQSWPHPVIAGGRLYLRDQGTLLCHDVRR